MKIFLSGGTGFVGGYVTEELLSRGHEIRLLVRRRAPERAGVEQVLGDIVKPETFAGALSGCDTAINLVGIIREFPSRGVTFRKLHVEATRNMVAAARIAGVPRLIQMSALGTRPNAVSAYHRTKFEAEEIVRASGLSWTIFRPSLIFGPRDEFVNMMAGYIRRFGAAPVIGDGRYRLQPIAVEDVARCFALALEMPQTAGTTFELCGPDRFTYLEMLDCIGRALGKKVCKLVTPLPVMKLIVPFLEGFPFFPLTSDQMTMLLEENICDGSWRDTFSFQPVRFEEGIRRWLRP